MADGGDLRRPDPLLRYDGFVIEVQKLRRLCKERASRGGRTGYAASAQPSAVAADGDDDPLVAVHGLIGADEVPVVSDELHGLEYYLLLHPVYSLQAYSTL